MNVYLAAVVYHIDNKTLDLSNTPLSHIFVAITMVLVPILFVIAIYKINCWNDEPLDKSAGKWTKH